MITPTIWAPFVTVIHRNDFSLNCNLLQFVGYIFDERLQFNLIGWASNSSAAFVEGGYVSRPTTKIDPHLVHSGSVWREPIGVYGTSGRARGMYDDYENRKRAVIRLGGSYTHSRENRFSNVGQDNPDNTGLYNSDGVTTFATGAFAPGVTVRDATYRMLAVDGGVKWRGLAINVQYFSRWLNRFTADGPLPLTSTLDQGFEMELSKFVVPQRSGNSKAAPHSSSVNSAIPTNTLPV